MPTSLIRGKYVVCKANDRHSVDLVEDGAVLQQDGVIVAVGKYSQLARDFPFEEEIGSPNHVVMPGLINAHHHVGLTPFQLGSPDLPLELWIAARLAARNVDPYLDTLYSAIEMIESGVTTVQHIGGFFFCGLERCREITSEVLKAYADIGMRASYALAIMDQNRFVYAPDTEFLERLPTELAEDMASHFAQIATPVEDQFLLFTELWDAYSESPRTRIQLAPANLQWCSDRALEMAGSHAEAQGALMHMHLLETPYQRDYAARRTGSSALKHLHALGLLGPGMTLGHGVWLTQDDIELVAGTGTRICHNCSSNMRLRSGRAPVNALCRHGVPVSIGIDEAGINDDRDMLLEMRLVLNKHREPGMDDDMLTCPQIFQMATEHAAHTTPFGAQIGTIEPGKAADLVVLDWRKIAHPFLHPDTPVVDAILRRAKPSAVETVLIAGEPVLRDGKFTQIDKQKVMDELFASLAVPPTPDETSRQSLSRRIYPHVKAFYEEFPSEKTNDPI